MKRIFILLSLLILLFNVSNGQLLNDPALTMKDIEKALLNPDHLRGILLEHNFKYDCFNNEDCTRSECWESELRSEWTPPNAGSISVPMLGICIYEYKPNFESKSRVITTIDLQIYKDPLFANKLEIFLQSIRSNYPERIVSTDNRFTPFTQNIPYLVYKNKNSKIEIEIKVINDDYSQYDQYNINFILLK